MDCNKVQTSESIKFKSAKTFVGFSAYENREVCGSNHSSVADFFLFGITRKK